MIIQFIKEKLDIATKLHNGELGATRYDAMIIVSAIIDALSSLVFQNSFSNRERFTKILLNYNTIYWDFSKISVPLLLDSSEVEISIKDVEKLNPFPAARILIGDDIDKTEQEILEICPYLSKVNLSKFNYANILYKELRCSLIHEYSVSNNSDLYQYSQKNVLVSYNNFLADGDKNKKNITFHFKPLCKVIISIAENIDNNRKNNFR